MTERTHHGFVHCPTGVHCPTQGGDRIILPPPAVDGTAASVTPLCRLRADIAS